MSRLRNMILTTMLALMSAEIAQTIPVTHSGGCFDGSSRDYRGTRDFTALGLPCLRWDAESTRPDGVKVMPNDGGAHNFCRNPDGNIFGTWCYASANATVELCRIPKCQVDGSVLLWTSRKSVSNAPVAFINKVSADPVYPLPDELHYDVIEEQNSKYFTTMTSDYKNTRIFVADYSNKYVATFDMGAQVMTKYFEGMPKRINQLAYDWVSGNLYWADSGVGFIVVAERNLKFYTNLNIPLGIPYGVAVHTKRRELYFGLRTNRRVLIMVSDLSGQRSRRLRVHFDTHRVPNIAIDYDEDRIYWIDDQLQERFIRSCDLNGEELRTIGTSNTATFVNLAVHKDVIYASDFSTYDDGKYKLWLFSKRGSHNASYSLDVKSRGVTVYDDRGQFSLDEISELGECHGAPSCDHVCLPRLNTRRECVCMLGYHKVGDTGCIAHVKEDQYLLVADEAQKKIFQLPLDGHDRSDFSVIPIDFEFERKVTTMALNVKTRTLYWSDGHTNTMYKSEYDGSNPTVIKTGFHARSLAIDYVTGNIYFADDDTGYIYVMNDDGMHLKTLLRPTEDIHSSSFVRHIALDLMNGHLYWSDHKARFGNSYVRRMRMDGSSPEVVFKNVFTPRQLVIAYERDSLILLANVNMVHEIPLSSMKDLDTSKPSLPTEQELPATHWQHMIKDIAVNNQTLYLVDDYRSAIRQYNLDNLTDFSLLGKDMLYQPVRLAPYRSSMTEKYIARLPNPCADREQRCSHLCLPVTSRTSACICQDGRTGVDCAEDAGFIDAPPSYGTSCPSSFRVDLQPCQNKTRLEWMPPTWEDDLTAVSSLTLTSPSIEAYYEVGNHAFEYTATDTSGNIAHCSFTVTVSKTLCDFNFDSRFGDVVATSPACEAEEYVHYFRCADESQLLQHEDSLQVFVRNVCLDEGEWKFPDYPNATCRSGSPSSTSTSPEPLTTSSQKPEYLVSESKSTTNLTKTTTVPTDSHQQDLEWKHKSIIIIVSVIAVAVFAIIISMTFCLKRSRTKQSLAAVFWQRSFQAKPHDSSNVQVYNVFG